MPQSPEELVAQIAADRKAAPTLAHYADKNSATIGRFTHLIIDLDTAAGLATSPGDRLHLQTLANLLLETGQYPFRPEAIGPRAQRDAEARARALMQKLGMRAPEATAVPVLVPALVFCPHCGVQHIDHGEWAEKNHSRHLCQRRDGGCGRFFFTKANVGVASPPGATPVAATVANETRGRAP